MAKLEWTLIAASPPFCGLMEPDLRKILQQARVLRYDRGKTVFQEGGPATSFFLLLNGRLKVVQTTTEGQQVVMRLINPGDLFGFAAALGVAKYPGTSIATIESLAVAWPQSYWPEMTERFPAILANAMRGLGEHLQSQQNRLREMATQKVERRIAHALLRLGKQAGKRTDQGIEIDFPVTRQDLADMTGATLFTVSRIISTWDQACITGSERQYLIIRDPHALLAIADGAGAPSKCS